MLICWARSRSKRRVLNVDLNVVSEGLSSSVLGHELQMAGAEL